MLGGVGSDGGNKLGDESRLVGWGQGGRWGLREGGSEGPAGIVEFLEVAARVSVGKTMVVEDVAVEGAMGTVGAGSIALWGAGVVRF